MKVVTHGEPALVTGKVWPFERSAKEVLLELNRPIRGRTCGQANGVLYRIGRERPTQNASRLFYLSSTEIGIGLKAA